MSIPKEKPNTPVRHLMSKDKFEEPVAIKFDLYNSACCTAPPRWGFVAPRGENQALLSHRLVGSSKSKYQQGVGLWHPCYDFQHWIPWAGRTHAWGSQNGRKYPRLRHRSVQHDATTKRPQPQVHTAQNIALNLSLKGCMDLPGWHDGLRPP